METAAHTTLKRLAIAYLRREAYFASTSEVRCPIARWVADIAGWRDARFEHLERPGEGEPPFGRRIRLDQPQTIIIECKQCRADFLRDSRRLDALLSVRTRLQGIRASIEEHRIKSLEPQLRRDGTSLFTELDEWDFASSRLPAYQRTLHRLEQVDNRLYGQTKFFRLARYAVADALYLAAPRGMIARRELPAGWGLLECAEEALNRREADRCPLFDEPDRLHVRIAAPQHNPRAEYRQRLLRNIAVAACKSPSMTPA